MRSSSRRSTASAVLRQAGSATCTSAVVPIASQRAVTGAGALMTPPS